MCRLRRRLEICPAETDTKTPISSLLSQQDFPFPFYQKWDMIAMYLCAQGR